MWIINKSLIYVSNLNWWNIIFINVEDNIKNCVLVLII